MRAAGVAALPSASCAVRYAADVVTATVFSSAVPRDPPTCCEVLIIAGHTGVVVTDRDDAESTPPGGVGNDRGGRRGKVAVKLRLERDVLGVGHEGPSGWQEGRT